MGPSPLRVNRENLVDSVPSDAMVCDSGGPLLGASPGPPLGAFHHLLQQIAAMRTVLGPPSQAGLLTSKRTVESLDVRGVDPRADAQLANPSLDLLEGPGKRLAANFHQGSRSSNRLPRARDKSSARSGLADF